MSIAEIKKTGLFLDNDDIDDSKPFPKRARISSISLSDRFIESIPNINLFLNANEDSSYNNSNKDYTLEKNNYFHRFSFNNSLLSQPPRFKKQIIDHCRIASYAFAFDIDGVLVRGPNTISHGVDAIKYLDGENPYNIKIPYIFVTNGGGKHEKIRAKDLSERLKTDIKCNQIIQGHTPMKELSNEFNNVLIIGGIGNTCKEIAKDYGFKNVFTSYDILKWDPSVSPYYEMSNEDQKYCSNEIIDFSKIKIDAIMVFADSRNWAVDQQIILELLMSKNGYMGTISNNFEEGPPIYFAHSDFVWSTNYKLVRYGMGALQVSIAALFREHTGKELKINRFGKPQHSTFKYTEKILGKWRKMMLEDHIEEIKCKSSNEDNTTLASDIFSSIDNFDDNNNNNNIFSNSMYAISETSNSENEGDNSNEYAIDDVEEEKRDNDEDDDDGNVLTFQSLNKLKLNKKRKQEITPIATKFSNTEDLPPPSTVYFVGDTPESDIRFANSHDESWFSILVNTGVYQPNSIPKYKPKKQCENVFEAVKFAVEREHEKELQEWNSNAIDI